MTTPELLIQAQGLAVSKGSRRILDVPSLQVKKGEFVAVTGPNGAGKSTLLKTLAYLEPNFEGELLFRGKQYRGGELLTVRRQLAMVFQDPLLLKGKVFDNVEMGLKIRGVARQKRKELVLKWLDRFQIRHLAGQNVRSLSGGEAQRVNLARAFVIGPEVIFLDEPFTYLDMPAKAALVGELKQILQETDTTAVMITHELLDIPYLADRMFVMMDGCIVQEGPVAEVLTRPASRKVAKFLGVENVWPLEQAKLLVADNQAPDQSQGTPWVCIRPENILLFRTDRDNAANVITGQVLAVQPYGYYYRIRMQAADLQLSTLLSTVHFSKAPQVGESITVQLPPDKLHLLWENQ